MKRILAMGVALTLMLSMLTACSKDDDSTSKDSSSGATTTTENESEEEPVPTVPVDITQGATEDMLKRSVLNEGDQSRLAEKVSYALENKEEITKICFLGDSITAGSAASSSGNQYTRQFGTWWEENVSYFVDVINAGIGATDSYLAAHRVERDVLSQEPDIIFIEFINDVDNDFYKSAMDSLIRRCLSAKNNPAVILIEMTMEDGTTPQISHSEVAKAYDVPVISYHDAVMPEIKAGTLQWTAISPDNIHPNDAGHILLGQLLTDYTNNVMKNIDTIDKEVKAFDKEAVTADPYKNGSIENRQSEIVSVTDEGAFTEVVEFQGKFTDGWGTKAGGSITFEVEAQNIGMLYNKSVDGTYGTVSIIVDGKELKPINADFTNGWGSYACMEEFYTSDAPAKHTVTITVTDETKPNFDIYSLLVS
ncbi:MAG: SGNH/GDSL hydrolase family protein [Clostridiales bacterium]|nr:SGNH/GDSL hydrolase family protein [Clostridiales bacterium]